MRFAAVPPRDELLERCMHARLTVLAGDHIDEGEKVWTLAGTGYAA